MKKEEKFKMFLGGLNHFFIFFVLVAFVITCCLLLFVSVLQQTMGILFTQENISAAAKATMINVILISLAFAAIDSLRRKFIVARPVKKITEATEKMINGDFDVRISNASRFASDNAFNKIIECINKMAEELSGIETLRTDFIANVSHEMKTPLAVMQNYAVLLKEPSLSNEKRMEYAQAIIDASKKLTDMMTNILKLNRLENQQIYPKAQRYSLGEQLCEVLLQYENLWEKNSIEIETDIQEDVWIYADCELLSLVWSNLFSNAFKFTKSGGKVSLSLSTEENFAVVKIRDTGCGMSAEVGAHIFEKFYQGDTSHQTQGNGLGLALVKRVIDIIQGEISVESALGVGTVFTVKIRKDENAF